jgi:hypothetical protein
MGERSDDPLEPIDPRMPGATADQPGAAETEQITAEIEATRAGLGDTIDELQERLSPRQIVSNARTAVTDAAAESARGVAHQATAAARSVASAGQQALGRAGMRVRRHSFPLTLVAVNCGLVLAMRRWNRHQRNRRPSLDRYGTRETEARASVSKTSEQKRGTAMSPKDLQSAVEDNPLAIGLAALAAGAAVGLMLPVTNVENQYLGETRDSMVSSAKEMAGQAAERVQDVVKQSAEEVVGPTSGDETKG